MMNRFIKAPEKIEQHILMLATLIFTIGLFIHLGVVPLMSDEGIRGLVALEMDLSGDYLTPTLNGGLYLNKPPLYNWILLAFFKLFNSHSLYVMRLPTVLSVILFTLSIFLYIRKYFGGRFAAINALLFLSTGKILFSDSNMALLDITHGWLLYLNFIVIIEFSRRNRYLPLFITSYAIIAVCYLMKGLPALVAQAVTLLAFFIIRQEFRRLISVQHAMGILLLAGIIGTYYFFYFYQNTGVSEKLINTVWDQSSQRTVLRYPFLKGMVHVLSFPFKFLYEMIPVSLLVVASMRRDFLGKIKLHPLLLYSFVFLIVNSLVYWFSPYWRVRYIFMLFPLAVTIMLYFYMRTGGKNNHLIRITDWLILCISTLGPLIIMAAPFFDHNEWPVNHIVLNSFMGVTMLLVTLLMFRMPSLRLVLFILLISISRLTVSILYMPVYGKMQKEYRHRELAMKVGQMMKDKELYLLGPQWITEDISFYITRETGHILYRNKEIIAGDVYYIADDRVLRNLRNKKIYFITLQEFYTRNEGRRLYLIQFI